MHTRKVQNIEKVKIGSNIRKWRFLKGVKQEHLAAHLGITKAAMSNIENDKTNITLVRVESIAQHLNLSVIRLFHDPLELLETAGQ